MNQNSQQTNQVMGRKTGFVVLFLLALGICSFADESVPCPTFSRPSSIATIRDSRLTEISGLVNSWSQPGILWVHNDSGDAAVVYAVDFEGQLLAIVQLVGRDGARIDAVDCEDIALGPGSNGSDLLYLADIGDNEASRESIRVYRFLEPAIKPDANGLVLQLTVECDAIEGVYPDGSRDAETLLVDPISGNLVIVSKDFIHARAYRLPISDGGMGTLEFLVEVPWGFMTGGDMSPDGTSILLRGYWNIEIWTRSSDNEWWAALAMSGCPVALAMDQQGEAIGFSADGLGYYTVSEGVHPPLNVYRILPEDTVD